MDAELFNTFKTVGLVEEFDWFAFDRKGQIGVFTSHSSAIVPEQVWESYENYGTVLNYFLGLQPELTPEEILNRVPAHVDDWEEYARTGLYAYDYASIDHGLSNNYFELKFRPENPLLSQDLDLGNKFIKAIPVLNIEFGGDSHVKCDGFEKLLIT